MTGSQKIRLSLTLFFLVVSLVVLAPTFFKEHLPAGWPGKPIKLGLDLKGGVYLVYEVDTKEAVKSQLAACASGIKAELKKEQAGVVRARQEGADTIEVTLLGDSGAPILDRVIAQNFPFLKKQNVRAEGNRSTVVYAITPEEAQRIEKDSVTQAIETVRNRVDQYGVTEPTIQRSGEKQIVIQLPDVKDPSAVKSSITFLAE